MQGYHPPLPVGGKIMVVGGMVRQLLLPWCDLIGQSQLSPWRLD